VKHRALYELQELQEGSPSASTADA
jgi:hypothetical protein